MKKPAVKKHPIKKVKPSPIDPVDIKDGKRIMCETRRQFEKAGFTESAIADELAIVAFSDPANHAEIAEGGELRFKTFKEQGKKRRAVKSIKEKTVITESKDGEKVYKTSTVEWTMHDKLEALGMAVDVIGIKKPVKHDLNVSGNLADLMRTHLAGKK